MGFGWGILVFRCRIVLSWSRFLEYGERFIGMVRRVSEMEGRKCSMGRMGTLMTQIAYDKV